MPKTATNSRHTLESLNTWRIEGVHPCEYASFYGSCTKTGALFYNCSDVEGFQTIPREDMEVEEWKELAAACLSYKACHSHRERNDLLRLRTWILLYLQLVVE